MKKLLLAALTCLSALSLAACGGKKTDPTTKPGGDTDPAPKKLVVGTNAEFQPFEYKDGTEFAGFDMDLIRDYGKWAGVTIEIQDMEFDAALAGVSTGKVDIAIAAITVNDARKENMSFSNTYYASNQVVVCKTGSSYSTLTTETEILNALKNKKIGCQRGTTGQYYIEGDEEWKFDGITGATCSMYDNAPLALKALENGQVDAVIIDEAPAKSIVASKFSTTLTVLNTALTSEEYAIAVKKNNNELVLSLNQFLAAYKSNGDYDKLIAKYFDAE